MKSNSKPIIIILGCLLYIGGLVLFAYLGVYNRFWADDWCYNADFKNLGLIGTLRGYSYITTYASNRFSLTLFSGFLYHLSVIGVQIMTPLTILFLLVGYVWLIHNVIKVIGFSINHQGILWLAAALPVYYTIYLAPHLYQDLYWRSGLLPYTAPIVFSIWIFAIITWQSTLEQPSRLMRFIIAPLAFLGGGFSEVGCTYLTTALGLYVIVSGIGAYKKLPWAVKSLPTASIALLFTILAMVVLIVSPTSLIRMQRYGEPASFTRLPYLIIFFTYQFIKLSIRDIPLPHFIVVITAAFLGFSLSTHKKLPMSNRNLFLLVFNIIGIAVLLIAAAHAPSAYIEQGPIAIRARIIPRFIMISALVGAAWVLGYWLGNRFQSKWLTIIGVILIVFAFAYAGRSFVITWEKIPIYAERATIWDDRDLIIRNAHEQGLDEIHVRAIDGYPVGGIRDWKPQPGHWVNQCAERYYGVQAIRADLP